MSRGAWVSNPLRLLAIMVLIMVAVEPPVQLRAAAPAVAAEQPESEPPLLFVYDTSASMGETDDGGAPRLEGAKSATIDVIYNLPASAKIGVWTYPNDGDCGPGRSVLDVGALDVSLLTANIQSLQPAGNTPTAAALRAASDSLRAQGFTSGTIVLVSDGEANCADDPCAVAAEIVDAGFDLTVETTGFNISESGRQQLQCIANATGGTYTDVTNAEELQALLARASTAALELDVVGIDATARAGGAHTITATVRNTSPSITATEASVALSFTAGPDGQYPAVRPPRLQLGNIPPGSSGTRSWTISTGLPGKAYPRVVAQAISTNAAQAQGTITISGENATLDEAGAILRDAHRIAILGDSYSSGEGAGSYFDTGDKATGCHRSFNTYAVALYGVTNPDVVVACSGAVAPEFLEPNHGRDREPQRDYLFRLFSDPATAPQAVLLTFGGNDIGFASIVQSCALPADCADNVVPVRNAEPLDCTVIIEKGEGGPEFVFETAACAGTTEYWTELRVRDAQAMRPTLKKLYLNISDAINRSTPEGGPRIPIIVLPYLQILTTTIGDGCAHMSNRERQFGVRLIGALNDAIAGAVGDAAGEGATIYYASDVSTALLPGHTVCADGAEDRYVNAIDIAKVLAPEDPATQAACAGSAVPGAPPAQAALTAECLKAAVREAGLQAPELMHPNANGHRAITNALVDWSNRSDVAQAWAEDKNRPLDTSGFLRVTESSGAPMVTSSDAIDMNLGLGTDPMSVTNGGTLSVTGAGYAPGSQARVILRSNPVTLAVVQADENGRVEATVRIPNDASRGKHLVDLDGWDDQGEPLLLRRVIDVSLGPPWWILAVAIVSAAMLVLAAVLYWRRWGAGRAVADSA